MQILDEALIHEKLFTYYLGFFGERQTDDWANIGAVNIWSFTRDGEKITIVCNPETGVCTHTVEK